MLYNVHCVKYDLYSLCNIQTVGYRILTCVHIPSLLDQKPRLLIFSSRKATVTK